MDKALAAESPTWDDLRVLLALHRHRSFLKAGKALGVSTSTVGRRIDALEASLGRLLVHRSSAGASVEPDALSLVHLAEQLELGLNTVRRDPHAKLAGSVRVSMGEGFVVPVTQVLSELRVAHPGLLLELMAEHHQVNLVKREADIAIRKTRSSSPALVERAVGKLRFALYAAPSYVERRLRIPRLKGQDFAQHDFVGYEGALSRLPHNRWLEQNQAKRFVIRTNSDFAIQEAALRGQGIALLAQPLGRALPLVQLETDVEPPFLPVFLAYSRELRRVPRIRLVADTLTTALRRGLA